MPTTPTVITSSEPERLQAHMQRVQERLTQLDSPHGQEEIQARADRVNDALPASGRNNLISQAFKATTNAKRLFWLRREAELVSQAAKPHSPCSSGCSHCCHINVLVAESEAKVIAKELGIKLCEPDPANIMVTGDYTSEEGLARFEREKATRNMSHFGAACPFLKNHQCAIYASRPMACRQQINMDTDNLLCQLVEGANIPVPYLNQQLAMAAQLLLWGQSARLADIRDWFPTSTTP